MLGYFLSSVAATSGQVTPIGKGRNKLIGKTNKKRFRSTSQHAALVGRPNRVA